MLHGARMYTVVHVHVNTGTVQNSIQVQAFFFRYLTVLVLVQYSTAWCAHVYSTVVRRKYRYCTEFDSGTGTGTGVG